jgi:hypothetical protein
VTPWLEKTIGGKLRLGEVIGGTDVFVPVGKEKIKLYGYSVALKAKMGPTGTCGLQIPTMIRRGCYHRAESSFA